MSSPRSARCGASRKRSHERPLNPVFVSIPHLATLERIQDHLCSRPDRQDAAEQLDREIGWAKTEARANHDSDGGRDRSCYFNSGCCCFSNGDITGIELAEGEIRLVLWTAESMDPSLRVLERRPLRAVFAGLALP